MNPQATERLYRRAKAARWHVPQDVFAAALDASAGRTFAGRSPSARELDRYLESLHLEDLALACACGLGHDDAWEHFIREYRPALYRAAAALDPSGGAREQADSLYAELYGVRGERPGRDSLFRYFHGRSSMATWLRAILSQRYVDRVRAERRLEPLEDEEDETAPARQDVRADVGSSEEHARLVALVIAALHGAVAGLVPKDLLRLRAYYEQDLTLAQIGRMMGEHEATVSRQLAKTRKALRFAIDRYMRDAGWSEPERRQCWESAIDDSGVMDLKRILSSAADRKVPGPERS